MAPLATWEVPVARWAKWIGGDALDLGFIEPLLRRRLSPLARGALHVANACAHDSPSASFVFASRHGELQRTVALLHTLAQNEEMSPALFSLSVLNSAAGIFSIARKDQAPATAVAAGIESFGYGLLEAYLRARSDPVRPIVYVYADAPTSDPFGYQPGDPDTVLALGLRIDHKGATRLQTTIRLIDAPETAPTSQVFACLKSLERGIGEWTTGQRHWHWKLQ